MIRIHFQGSKDTMNQVETAQMTNERIYLWLSHAAEFELVMKKGIGGLHFMNLKK